jgi:hypothetical protein
MLKQSRQDSSEIYITNRVNFKYHKNNACKHPNQPYRIFKGG